MSYSGDLPYPDYLHEQTHPKHLAAIAWLMGHEAPDPRTGRVLELACGSGSNLLPMAISLPEAEFVGLDLAGARIKEGQRLIAGAGLKNIKLVKASVTDVDTSWGTFDYIMAHGLFSWVGPEIRESILRLLAERLSPNGVAFISYNVYPGWSVRAMGSEAIRYFNEASDPPEVWVDKGLALLSHLSDAHNGGASAMGPGFAAEVKRLKAQDAGYVYGEYGGHDHQAFFFHRFAAQTMESGLRYLGEARLLKTLVPDAYRPDDPLVFANYGRDLVETQQYIDFASDRYFRQSLLTKGLGADSELELNASRVAEMGAACEVKGGGDIHSSTPVRFELMGIEVTEARPLIKSAIATLGRHWPQSVLFEDWLQMSRESLKWAKSPDEDADRRMLMAWAFEMFVEDRIELERHPIAGVRTAGRLPSASPLARFQATLGRKVSTLRHRSVTLTPDERALLVLLDGSMTIEALSKVLETAHEVRDRAGVLVPPGVPGVQQRLDHLGSLGLLIG